MINKLCLVLVKDEDNTEGKQLVQFLIYLFYILILSFLPDAILNDVKIFVNQEVLTHYTLNFSKYSVTWMAQVRSFVFTL